MEAAHLWAMFGELNSSRGSNGFGVSSITYVELDAWARLFDHKLSPFEVRAIKAIDIAYLDFQAEKATKTK